MPKEIFWVKVRNSQERETISRLGKVSRFLLAQSEIKKPLCKLY